MTLVQGGPVRERAGKGLAVAGDRAEAGLLGFALFGEQGWQEVRRLRAERAQLSEEIELLRGRRAALEKEIAGFAEIPGRSRRRRARTWA